MSNNPNTEIQYNQIIQQCQSVFINKAKDYGTSWRVYRTISIVDQIYIKAWRIRQIQDGVIQKIEDDTTSEFAAIVNYGIIGIMLLENEIDHSKEIPIDKVEEMYSQVVIEVRTLMMNKNNDYGEAWRNMSEASFVDLILTKLLRIKQILLNDGKTLVSEGIESNFADIINYAIFALILQSEKQTL